MTDVPSRDQIKPGTKVAIETKENQGTGKLTKGIVKNILTSSNSHPYGIMVELTDGDKGRVKQISEDESNETKQNFNELEYQKYLDEISNYRRQTTPQFEVEPIPISTKTILMSDVPKNEDKFIEFKETFHFDSQEKKLRESGKIEAADGLKKEHKKREHAIKKEISIAASAFGNTMGGKLYIGVNDDGAVTGLEGDLKSFDNSFDKFMRNVQDSIDTFTKDSVFLSEITFSLGENNSFLVLEVKPFRDHPIYIRENDEEEFYLRGYGRSKKLSTANTVNYIQKNF